MATNEDLRELQLLLAIFDGRLTTLNEIKEMQTQAELVRVLLQKTFSLTDEEFVIIYSNREGVGDYLRLYCRLKIEERQEIMRSITKRAELRFTNR
jgi:hypothetical protein